MKRISWSIGSTSNGYPKRLNLASNKWAYDIQEWPSTFILFSSSTVFSRKSMVVEMIDVGFQPISHLHVGEG